MARQWRPHCGTAVPALTAPARTDFRRLRLVRAAKQHTSVSALVRRFLPRLGEEETLGCAVILSEDVNQGRDYDGVRVASPFRKASRGPEVKPASRRRSS